MRRGRATAAALVAGGLLLAACSTPGPTPAGSSGSGSSGSASSGTPSASVSSPPPSASLPTTPGLPTSSTPGPGTSGLGDSYFPLDGNGGYDALHYDLVVTVLPGSRAIAGVATMTARALQPLTRLDLDLHGLTVASVTVGAAPAAFQRSGQKLVVTPSSTLPAGAEFRVTVRYAGTPELLKVASHDANEPNNGWYGTADGATVMGEPQGASVWFPVNEHPLDKATYDVAITVPAGLTAISNGLPVGAPVTSKGVTTWRWHSEHPMASYLVLLTVGKYDVRRTTSPAGLPIIDAVDPTLGSKADSSLAREAEVIDVLSQAFGPYPFEAAGAVIDPFNAEVALETQTRPVYAASMFDRGENTYILAHELAHQWFGDSVSLTRWRDIWRNEGFATYAEILWGEHIGQLKHEQVIDNVFGSISPGDSMWKVTIGDPGRLDLFSPAVYQRGGLALEALREKVGDDAFFTILKTWASDHRDGNGTTDEFIALAEKLSGQDLGPLFQKWLFTSGRPLK
jgi:aminopeptidase N